MKYVRLGDVMRRAQTRVDKDNTGLEYYVGGEHFDSGEMYLNGRGTIAGSTIGPMFYYGFKPGDFLLVSRNPHLKKAALVDFAGICSEKTFVLESADTSVLLPEFLPWTLQNERFWDYAQRNRHGSTNFFLNWSSLSGYELALPEIEEQQKLAEVLWAAQKLKCCYQRLLLATEETVKSRFIEMFGDPTIPTVKAKEVMSNIRNGLSPSRGGSCHATVLTLSAITQGSFDSSASKEDTFKNDPPSDKRVVSGDFYVCRGNGNKTLVGTGEYPTEDMPDLVFPDTMIAGHVDQSRVLLPFLRTAWKQDAVRRQIEASARTTNGIYKINQTIIGNVEIPLPPIELQQDFASFVAQVDKSEFALKQAIEGVSATMAAILNQELGMSDVQ